MSRFPLLPGFRWQPMTSGNVWRALGASVRGATHLRRNLPNQDALLWTPPEGAGTALTVAIADGHGSGACFRSDVGSAIAVRVATEVLSSGHRDPAAEIVARWRSAVAEHIDANPEPDGPYARRPDIRAYGSTLVAVHATESELLFVQIGDGDTLVVTATGQVERPFGVNPERLGLETESLCMSDAANAVQIAIRPLDGGGTAMVMLSTDGYANSFRDDGEFLRVPTDLLDMIRESGADRVNESLSSWLDEASRHGSGDDITTALLIPAENQIDGTG